MIPKCDRRRPTAPKLARGFGLVPTRCCIPLQSVASYRVPAFSCRFPVGYGDRLLFLRLPVVTAFLASERHRRPRGRMAITAVGRTGLSGRAPETPSWQGRWPPHCLAKCCISWRPGAATRGPGAPPGALWPLGAGAPAGEPLDRATLSPRLASPRPGGSPLDHLYRL